MNVFVNQMRKFLTRNAQVFKITLKTGVEFLNFFIFFRFFTLKRPKNDEFLRISVKICNSCLRVFDYVDYSGKLCHPPSSLRDYERTGSGTKKINHPCLRRGRLRKESTRIFSDTDLHCLFQRQFAIAMNSKLRALLASKLAVGTSL